MKCIEVGSWLNDAYLDENDEANSHPRSQQPPLRTLTVNERRVIVRRRQGKLKSPGDRWGNASGAQVTLFLADPHPHVAPNNVEGRKNE